MSIRNSGQGCRAVRTLFVSDVHLGCKYAHAEAFLDFLQAHDPETIYIVGDFIDGWRLRNNWYWNETNNRILRTLIEMAECGVKLVYTPGNHDEFLRGFLYDFDIVEIVDEAVHRTADGRYLYITHGDRFDHVECSARWLSVIGARGYDLLCWGDKLVNRVRRRLNLSPCNFSGWAKRRVKRAVQFVSDFETRIVAHARQLGCDGVVCGHIHTPVISHASEVTYYNTGDWVENCTAIVEDLAGELSLVHWRRDAVPVDEPQRAQPLRLAALSKTLAEAGVG